MTRLAGIRTGILVSLGLVLLMGGSVHVSHAQTAPPAPPITVLIRTTNGVPVPDLTVTLRPAPPVLGGPTGSPPARQGHTDAQGAAAFAPLDGAIWYLTLSGTFADKSIEDPTSQGKPPWGTNPTGNGFPISADPNLELDPGGDTDTPILVPLLITDRGDRWLVGLDLGSATGQPLSLPAAIQTPAGTATHTATPPVAATRPAPPAPLRGPTLTPTLMALAALPVLAVLTGLGGLAAYRRRHPYQPAPAAYLSAASGRKEPHSHG